MVIKKGPACRQAGFTLVELLIVMVILAILMVMMVAILNPTAQVNKGYDARRKKDINRIKIAFEEYYNDRGCYPTYNFITGTDISGVVDPTKSLVNDANCNTGVFAPWLNPWPCDPKGKHYVIFTEFSNCPKWFQIVTKLDNLKDQDIPPPSKIPKSMGDVNYGASSTNISWTYEDTSTDPTCRISDMYGELNCFMIPPGGGCDAMTCSGSNGVPKTGCSGDNCYAGPVDFPCKPSCKVLNCGQGRDVKCI